MIPIVSIVGKSDSGKTTLIEKLLPELTRRGLRVATVKHDTHGFEVDHKGKDSWRHKQAGAHTVVISSPQKIALIRDVERDLNLGEIRGRLIQDVDLILSEGYKNDVQPKIEIFRKEVHQELLCTPEDHLVAIVSNQPFNIGVPCFDLDDMKGLGDFIEKTFVKQEKRRTVSLRVNGKTVSLTSFVSDFVVSTISGMVSVLKGCANPKQIEIHIDKEGK
jgi:molybdopterin-guanine dinucleotide biosynthesis adapter protein